MPPGMVHVELLGGPEAGRVFALDEAAFVVGRDADNDLSVADARVSRRHARFCPAGRTWMVEDLGSKNGVRINGDKVKRHLLRCGDLVAIGPVLLRFHSEPSPLTSVPGLGQEEVTRAMTGGLAVPESQRRLGLLLEIAAALDTIGSMDELLSAFCDLVVHLFDPSFCVLRFGDESSCRPTTARDDDAAASREKVDELINRWNARGESVLVTDVDSDDCCNSDASALRACRIRTAMGAPILVRDQIAGFLYVDQRAATARPFDDSDLMLLIGASRLVSAAAVGSSRFAQMSAENRILRATRGPAGKLVGESAATRLLRNLIETKIALVKSSVLLSGETGTGKSLIAEAIHLASPRAKEPFVKVNCAAIPRDLIESELFGHEKGAFTGATSKKIGLFEAAAGGTIFLDEIGELDQRAQAKLLSVLQDRQLQPVGSTKPVDIDVRVLAASNRDLRREVGKQRFRADLYYRLNVVALEVPPLRERREDIPDLARHFLRRSCEGIGRQVPAISQETMDVLVEYNWPGNIRELANSMERAAIFTTEGEPLAPRDLPHELDQRCHPALQRPVASGDERQRIVEVLAQTCGNKREAARRLGWYPQKLYDRLRRYEIEVPERQGQARS